MPISPTSAASTGFRSPTTTERVAIMADPHIVLIDTNAIIEAVRTGCWAAIAARFRLETVKECHDEAQRGDSTRPSYVKVGEPELALLAAVHTVSRVERAKLALECECADGLDDGERDLLAYAWARANEAWLLCSPDKATVRAAVELKCQDRLISLDELARRAGVRPRPPVYDHHTESWLTQWRTAALLGIL